MIPPKIHSTAYIEEDVLIGQDTKIWHHVHIRGPSTIGQKCIIGGKSYIAYDVQIGDLVKINSNVYICAAVRIERGVMISAGVIFTNDIYPRATETDFSALKSSEPDEDTQTTIVREGATIGAGAIIGAGIEIGRFAMIGMGAVVTKTVPDFHLVLGSPARSVGFICRCGRPFCKFSVLPEKLSANKCKVCLLEYEVVDGVVHELNPPV